MSNRTQRTAAARAKVTEMRAQQEIDRSPCRKGTHHRGQEYEPEVVLREENGEDVQHGCRNYALNGVNPG